MVAPLFALNLGGYFSEIWRWENERQVEEEAS